MNQNFISEVSAKLSELKSCSILTGWSFTATKSRSLQRLFSSPDGLKLHCHQSRQVCGDSYKLSVFTPTESDEFVGTASIDLVTYLPIDEQLNDAIAMSKNSRNKAWNLAKPPAIEPTSVETCDPLIRDEMENSVAKIEDEFTTAISKTNGIALNSAELFVNYHFSQILNSEGIKYSTELSELYLEAAMEKSGQQNDKEVHEYTTSVTVADLNVTNFVNECALQVATLGDSKEPTTTQSATIVIKKEALSQMLDALLKQLSCANEYTKLPFLNVGDQFGGGIGDSLNIKLDPKIPCMVLSSAYTTDGLTATPGILIENNKVQNRLIPNRFGQYLNLKPNGISGNIVVKTGTLTDEMLNGRDYIEIIKFSSLLIDSQKLTWSSEIKLGRQISADGSVTLIKGGVVSGNMKENFTDCWFSATEGIVNEPQNSYAPPRGYKGPDAMLITRGVSIAGKEVE